MVESLDGVKYAVSICVGDACGLFTPRQRGSFEGAIRSF